MSSSRPLMIMIYQCKRQWTSYKWMLGPRVKQNMSRSALVDAITQSKPEIPAGIIGNMSDEHLAMLIWVIFGLPPYTKLIDVQAGDVQKRLDNFFPSGPTFSTDTMSRFGNRGPVQDSNSHGAPPGRKLVLCKAKNPRSMRKMLRRQVAIMGTGMLGIKPDFSNLRRMILFSTFLMTR